MKSIVLFCLIIGFFQFNKVTAQTTYRLPPNQPEQDACNAIQLCGNSFSTPYGYTGRGLKLDLDSTPCSPQPGGGETNSVWLELHAANAGNIVFALKPVNVYDNYDFAIIDATGKNCSALTLKDVIRCNYNNNLPGSNVNGITGLSDTSRTPFIQKDAFGESFCQAVFAQSGGDYLIMINSNSTSSGGFTIDFTGSTATFSNTVNPQLKNADVPCTNSSSIILKLNTDILCSSIAADGSDFTTNAPVNIISASGINCTGGEGYTNSIIINFSSVIPDGNYTINAKTGSDNNTLTGFCGNELSPPSSLSFIVQTNSKRVIDNEFICYQQLPFLWHGYSLNGNDSGKVYKTPSAAGCDSFTVLNLKVSNAPQQISISKNICDGDTYELPWDSAVATAGSYVHHYTNTNGCDSVVETVTISVTTPTGGNVQTRDSTIQTGFCENGSVLLRTDDSFSSYLWNTGETTNSIIVKVAGAYSLIAKDNFGCTTIDTFVVAAYQFPTPVFSSIENICNGGTKVLDAGPTSTYYLWNDGSNKETIIANKPGKFWVTLTNKYSCTVTDTVHVVPVQNPSDFLLPAVTKCSFKLITLTSINSFDTYTWSNGNKTKSIDVTAGGFYWLDATDYNGCTGRDSIRVIDSTCPEYFFMPTAFTPNNDFLNDIFKPTFAGPITGYHFSIYNRWGALIFTSNNPLNGWDGMVKGFQQPIGAYIWICSYSLDGQPLHTEKGTVTLLR